MLPYGCIDRCLEDERKGGPHHEIVPRADRIADVPQDAAHGGAKKDNRGEDDVTGSLHEGHVIRRARCPDGIDFQKLLEQRSQQGTPERDEMSFYRHLGLIPLCSRSAESDSSASTADRVLPVSSCSHAARKRLVGVNSRGWSRP